MAVRDWMRGVTQVVFDGEEGMQGLEDEPVQDLCLKEQLRACRLADRGFVRE